MIVLLYFFVITHYYIDSIDLVMYPLRSYAPDTDLLWGHFFALDPTYKAKKEA